MEALKDEFAAVNTQPLGISVDSFHCHANWAVSLGGISFPLLADFNPKGDVGDKYGVYISKAGLDARATVIINGEGQVVHASMVEPGGQRNMQELLALCKNIGASGEASQGKGLATVTTLYVKSKCGFSLKAINALKNLGLESSVNVVNISEDATAAQKLENAAGNQQVPCLIEDGNVLLESDAIVKHLVQKTQGWY